MSTEENSEKSKKQKKTKHAENPYEEPERINPEVAAPDRALFQENPLLNETELGNTLRFTWLYAALAFFHHELKKWFVWEKTHWAVDTSNKALQYLVHVLLKDPTFRKSVDPDWYCASFSNSKLRAVLKIAADLLPLPAPLDSHPYYLNVKNGTINLKTGDLLKHDPKNYITKLAPIEYLPDAKCPKWFAFLNRAFPDNPAGIAYIQKVIGYALTADVTEKCFFILYGPDGNNGKSLLINVLRAILGLDYRIQIAAESLTINRVSAIRSDIARMKGYRFASASETDKAYKFNEPLIKTLTGSDPVTARKLYANEIEFTPELKLFIATNARPQFNLADRAMMSRVNVIPFMVSIPPGEQNRNLTAELIAEEGVGILAWAVQGAVMWHKERLGKNPFDQDSAVIVKPVITLKSFIDTCCTRNQKGETKTSDLLTVFNAFKDEQGDESPDMKIREFGMLLSNEGFALDHKRAGNFRPGLVLNEKGLGFLQGETTAPPTTVKGVEDVKDTSEEKSAEGAQ